MFENKELEYRRKTARLIQLRRKLNAACRDMIETDPRVKNAQLSPKQLPATVLHS